MLTYLLTIALLCTQTFAAVSCTADIEFDGMAIAMAPTAHDSFATPDCKALGLSAASDLKCDDGNWIAYNPLTDEKFPLASIPFQICLDDELPEVEDGYVGNVDHLRNFWSTVQSAFSEAENCPAEALECYTFDVFGEKYVRDGGVLDSFIDIIPLDTPSELKFYPTIGQNVREFMFYDGLVGQVLELDNGEIYATLNTKHVEEFTLFITPVMKNGGDWKYVIYREDTSEEIENGEPLESLRRELAPRDAVEEDFFQERLLRVPAHQRRHLQTTRLLTITFLYDQTVISYGDALSKASFSIIETNNALGHDFDYQLVLKGVIRVSDGIFSPNAGSGSCGAPFSNGGFGTVCQTQGGNLPSHQRGDLYHCFYRAGSFAGSAVGCAGQNYVGVTEVGHHYSSAIIRHEIGHQLGMDHDKSQCWCHSYVRSWDWGCWCHKRSCGTELCTTMHRQVTSSTGHVTHPSFTAANKNEARDQIGIINNQADNINTWQKCSDENGSCQCDGTVRYGKSQDYIVTGFNERCPAGTEQINSQGECFNAYEQLKSVQGWNTCTSGCKISGDWGHVAQCGVHMSFDHSGNGGNQKVHFKTNLVDGHSPGERWKRICRKVRNPELQVTSCSESTKWSDDYACRYAYNDNNRQWATASQGVGSWIQYEFGGPKMITSMQFQNRDCGPNLDCGDSLGATLEFSDGSFQYVTFNDRSGINTIALQPVQTSFVKMSITSVYSTADNGAQILKFFGYNPELHVTSCTESTKWNDDYACRYAYSDDNRQWATASQGVGSWIQYWFVGHKTIGSMQFQNRDCGPHLDCGDSLSATLEFSDGSFQHVTFNDRSGINTIALQPVLTSFVKMTITSVYSKADNGASILKFFGYLPTGIPVEQWLTRPVQGSVSCSSSVFGDPVPGVSKKECQCAADATTAYPLPFIPRLPLGPILG